MENFLAVLLHYFYEILPAIAIGFFISGLVHELIPEDLVHRYLGSKGIIPIFISTLIGTILPICCWGSLPIAVSFYKKGARLGPILAFLVATPATSISALAVTYSILGLPFAIYIFFAVIVMGVSIGIIGNWIPHKPAHTVVPGETCPHCVAEGEPKGKKEKSPAERIVSIVRYAFWTLPKEIGRELIIGIILAAVVTTYLPLGHLIKTYLSGWLGYLFGVIFGLLTYLCSTASVPFVDSLMKQGMSYGAGMTLLLIGPITSYGTILILRKEYGMRVLVVFLAALILLSVALGIGFQWIVEQK